MQKDLPIQGPSTFAFRGPSGVPQGNEWCLLPVLITLPESLSHGVTMLNDEPTFLQVDILQFTMDKHESKTPFLSSGSTSTSPHMPCYGASPQDGESSQHDHGGQ